MNHLLESLQETQEFYEKELQYKSHISGKSMRSFRSLLITCTLFMNSINNLKRYKY